MTPILVQITAGPAAGKGLRLERSPITFGRSPDNTVVLDLAHVSRRHGELRYEDGRWLLVNHSPNGTKLGSRLVTRQRYPLTGPDAVRIGDVTVLRLFPEAPAAAATGPPARTDAAAPQLVRSLSGRAKLWIGIGIYMLIMFGFIVFLLTASRGQDQEVDHTTAVVLTAEQIRDQVRTPPMKMPPDARRARKALDQASQFFTQKDEKPLALYRAHDAYRRALSYQKGDTFEHGIDQRRYQDVQRQLSEQVTQQYHAAYTLLRSGQFRRAYEGFNRLTKEYYPAYGSLLFKNAQQHAAAARQAREERRRR